MNKALFNALIPPLTAKGRLRRIPHRIMVVVAGLNPSFSYYLAPRLFEIETPVQIVDLSNPPSLDDARSKLSGVLVLFCRYTSAAWMRAIETSADEIAGVGLFVDDDINELACNGSVPLTYRLRLLMLHLIHRHRLKHHCDILYVASPVLAARLADAHPCLLTPVASKDDIPIAFRTMDGTKVAFHSTSVHSAEHRWLRTVIGSALAHEPSLSFEVFAGLPLSWWWRNVPRTKIFAPVPWPHYRADSRERGADLLLAPLIPSPANKARSWTKRIDAMRLGAALLVSDSDVYNPDPEELSLGMCVPLELAAWSKAIRELARDRGRLARLRDLNRAHVLRASATCSPLITTGMLPG